MPEPFREWNLEGLPGPAHNFAGLAHGNLASLRHGGETSHPRLAALQALDKMRLVHGLGLPVAVMPPHERPCLSALRRLGFRGSGDAILAQARRDAPDLFLGVFSSSAMWTANAATVSPAPDCADGRVHFTPANLVSQFHRSLETEFTARLLRLLFPPGPHFSHHPSLPSNLSLRDEGAANHLRLAPSHGSPAWEIFVHGDAPPGPRPSRSSPSFLPRQTLAASRAVARWHHLDPSHTLFLPQNPAAIQAGAFHNDVVAVANEQVLLYHAQAFTPHAQDAWERLAAALPAFHPIRVDPSELSLAESIDSYLFNSQLLSLPGGGQALLAPSECQKMDRARACLDRICSPGGPITQVHFLPLRESMKNGGGPACLRLRTVLDDAASAAMHPGVRYYPALDASLRDWVHSHYRETLHPNDLADPALRRECRRALDELTTILRLGSLYPFQR